MKYNPHAYQVCALDFLLQRPSAALFLEVGLGKTVVALTAIAELKLPTLVIAPLRVAENVWSQEAAKWDHLQRLKISKVLGTERQRRAALVAPADIYVTNRENVEWLVGEYGRRWPFEMVVIDELSSFKSPRAKRFRALRKVRPLTKRVVGLTGTPAPNGLIDLWSQIYLLDSGERLGRTLSSYRDKYFLPDKRNGNIVYSYKLRPRADEAIYRQLSDLCISMTAAGHIELPERVDNYVEARLSAAELKLYRQLEQDMFLPFAGGDIDAGNAAVLAGKLLQMANGAVYDEHGGVRNLHQRKLEALEDLHESANGKPLLIFYAYRHDKDRLRAFFRGGARVLDTPADINDWTAGKIPVALAHPASAGHGLNLQAGGSTIIWFGLSWSLELYLQANGRIHRQGQQQTVVVHHIIAKGTIDERVRKVLASKDKTQAALLAAVRV